MFSADLGNSQFEYENYMYHWEIRKILRPSTLVKIASGTEGSKSNILCCARNIFMIRGLHDAHRTRILRVTIAWHTCTCMRQIHAGFMPDARVTSANPTQMLRGIFGIYPRRVHPVYKSSGKHWLTTHLSMIWLIPKSQNHGLAI
jgi:hypothetical protein